MRDFTPAVQCFQFGSLMRKLLLHAVNDATVLHDSIGHGAAQRVLADEGFITLNVEDRVEFFEPGTRSHLGNPVGSGRVIGAGEHALGACGVGCFDDRGVVGSNDTALGDAER
jgi:hypothetical protein